jgi:site-specific DNA recombinase
LGPALSTSSISAILDGEIPSDCPSRVKKGRRYRYYVSTALISEAGQDHTQRWRLAAQEIEDCVISILVDALTSQARLLERLNSPGMPGDQIRRLLGRAARLAALLRSAPGERAKIVQELVDQVIVDDKRIMIKMRRGALLGVEASLCASEEPSGSTIELTAAVDFKRRGAETKLVLPGLAQHNHASKGDPALIKAIARGRAWFEELATGRARSLEDLAKRDGITRRYIRRLVDLAFLSPQLVGVILQGRQPVVLTATRLTELDLPLDWAEQHRLLVS